jgi:hypothetical protein
VTEKVGTSLAVIGQERQNLQAGLELGSPGHSRAHLRRDTDQRSHGGDQTCENSNTLPLHGVRVPADTDSETP